MPMPLNRVCSTTPSAEPEIVDVTTITDPRAREIATRNNNTIERWKEMKELESRTINELNEALRQYHVLHAIPTLTHEERAQNQRLTLEKSRKVMIIQKRREEIDFDICMILEQQRNAAQRS